MVLAAGAIAAAPGVADAQQPCPEANPTYLSNCGPTFVLPAWGDAGGWTDPSQYATIQLADVNGDGRDELIGRGDNGVQIHRFDTTFGQWRPQVDAKGTQLVLTDFRSPLPSEEGGPNWNQPQYALTIQSANLDGRPGEEVYGRFPDGVRAYTYVPPQGTTDVDGGSWQRIPGTAGFSDAVGGADPSIYTTIHSGVLHDGSTYIFGRRHPTADHPGPLGFAVLRAGEWVLGSADNPTPLAPPDQWSDAECGQPACYLNVRGAEIMTSAPDPSTGYDQTLQGIGQVLSRTSAGVGALTFDSYNRWFPVGGAPDHPFTAIGPGDSLQYPGPFGDAPGAPDCPFSSNGASGPGSGDCLGASPSYYETLRTANIDGKPGQEVLARASDGLRVKRWYGATRYGYESLATLTDLAGAGLVETVAPGVWGSIRTGDIDGNGRDEVLALDGSGLQIWSYDPAGNAWTKRTQSTPLALAANPWLTHPEYYSTIETGDVDGDGHDDVVARGQFGIRTWFFDRRGTGAWEPYLAEGYPDFPSRQCPSGVTAPCGQQGAYNALNPLVASSGTVRDVWTVQDVPVDMASTLSDLQADLAKPLVGNCVNQTRLKPPTYASCTPPANSSAFTADEWTTVVNELLSEAYYAEQVVGHFDDITSLRQQLFISEQAVLPAIKDDLDLAGAAGNTADFDLQGFFAGTTGIAASIAGAAAAEAPELSAGLWVVSELISMLPSASRTANSSFPTTYGGLVNKFATVVQETDNALTSQSQQVRNDLPLMTLVSDLRTSGTWKLDQTGMKSAANQAFALWVYQALLPTMYSRYSVTNCVQSPPPPNTFNCQDLPSGPYVVGGSDTSATWLGPTNDSPCSGYYGTVYCDYLQDPGTIPDDLASTLFGPLSSTCSYVPNNSNTAWTFDDCTVGVPVATSVGANGKGWSFATYSGSPVVAGGASAVRAAPRVARATAAAASASSSRDVLSPLRFRGRHVIARGLRLRRMRVRVDRVLFEHGRREELAVTRSGGRLRPVTLRHVRGGLFASTRRTGPRVRLRLRRLDARGRARVDLQLSRVRTRDIRALCGVLPAAVSRAGRPLELETRLRLRDGASVGRIAVRQDWRCVRDRKGEFSGIRPVASKRAAARPGLAVRLDAPQVSASGRRATVRVTVANRRRPGAGRVVSSLHNLRIAGSAGGAPRTVGVEELRAGRSRTMRLSFRVPRRAGGRACVRVEVHADSARGAAARRCARIAGAPRFTG